MVMTRNVNQRQLLEFRNELKIIDLCGPHFVLPPFGHLSEYAKVLVVFEAVQTFVLTAALI